MNDTGQQYQALISEIIAKQAIILGSDIAVLKARNVPGLVIDESGKVVSLEGDPKKTLEHLIDGYVELSGQIVKSTLASIFEKYPHIKNS